MMKPKTNDENRNNCQLCLQLLQAQLEHRAPRQSFIAVHLPLFIWLMIVLYRHERLCL